MTAPAPTLHGEFFHTVDFPTMIRRFDLNRPFLL